MLYVVNVGDRVGGEDGALNDDEGDNDNQVATGGVAEVGDGDDWLPIVLVQSSDGLR